MLSMNGVMELNRTDTLLLMKNHIHERLMQLLADFTTYLPIS